MMKTSSCGATFRSMPAELRSCRSSCAARGRAGWVDHSRAVRRSLEMMRCRPGTPVYSVQQPGSRICGASLRAAPRAGHMLNRTAACARSGRSPACRERRARKDRDGGRAGRGLDAEPFLVQSCAIVPSSFMHSIAFSIWLAQLLGVLAERRGPDEAGRVQIGELELRVVLHRPGDDRIAGDIGVGAAREDGLHGVGLRAEALDLPADLRPPARAPSSRRPSPCSPRRSCP